MEWMKSELRGFRRIQISWSVVSEKNGVEIRLIERLGVILWRTSNTRLYRFHSCCLSLHIRPPQKIPFRVCRSIFRDQQASKGKELCFPSIQILWCVLLTTKSVSSGMEIFIWPDTDCYQVYIWPPPLPPQQTLWAEPLTPCICPVSMLIRQ